MPRQLPLIDFVKLQPWVWRLKNVFADEVSFFLLRSAKIKIANGLHSVGVWRDHVIKLIWLLFLKSSGLVNIVYFWMTKLSPTGYYMHTFSGLTSINTDRTVDWVFQIVTIKTPAFFAIGPVLGAALCIEMANASQHPKLLQSFSILAWHEIFSETCKSVNATLKASLQSSYTCKMHKSVCRRMFKAKWSRH